VALRYEPAKGAPRVIAEGQGPIATKIRELAAEHRVPMVQDVPLARALHDGCDVGAEISAELYGAVAKVLAFVMSLKARGSAAGLHRNPNSAPTAA
jgi:flagellar biosynthesis protein FlhB